MRTIVSLQSAVSSLPPNDVLGDIDDRRGVAGGLGHGGRLLTSLAAHLVGVPAVVADELEALVGDVLGDGGDEWQTGDWRLQTAGKGKIRTYGAVENGAVGIGAVGLGDLHLLDGEGVADDVLGETFQVGAFRHMNPKMPCHDRTVPFFRQHRQ